MRQFKAAMKGSEGFAGTNELFRLSLQISHHPLRYQAFVQLGWPGSSPIPQCGYRRSASEPAR